MLTLIDMRLWQAFPEHNNEPFGGRSTPLTYNKCHRRNWPFTNVGSAKNFIYDFYLRPGDIPVAKIQAIHSESNEVKKANSDTIHSLKVNILLARDARVMLTANLQTETVLISFDNYKEPTIVSLKGKRVVPIAITVHKSQGLTLNKAIIDLDIKDFEKLQCIKDGKRLLERVDKEKHLVFMIPEN
ncbi:hypothetical protein RhiirB3_424636 [Rhizophagus irregularis]|nr:hypothetical protein RhiirB3_424636 [Rhizophagus irregularis]